MKYVSLYEQGKHRLCSIGLGKKKSRRLVTSAGASQNICSTIPPPLSVNAEGHVRLTWHHRLSAPFTAAKERWTINLHHPRHAPSCPASTSPSLPGIGWGAEGNREGLRAGSVALCDMSPWRFYRHVQQRLIELLIKELHTQPGQSQLLY